MLHALTATYHFLVPSFGCIQFNLTVLQISCDVLKNALNAGLLAGFLGDQLGDCLQLLFPCLLLCIQSVKVCLHNCNGGFQFPLSNVKLLFILLDTTAFVSFRRTHTHCFTFAAHAARCDRFRSPLLLSPAPIVVHQVCYPVHRPIFVSLPICAS